MFDHARTTSALSRRQALTGAAAVLAGVGLTACSKDSGSGGGSSSGGGSYPMELKSPYGTTTLKAQPKRVAVVSATDLDIALALGIMPVTAPKFGKTDFDTWTKDGIKKVGGNLSTYDSTDGVDYEAIAAAKPDVILATSGWTLDKDYPKLKQIAPVVSYQGKDGISSMTWDARTREAAKALGVKDKGESVIAGVNKKFEDAKKKNPELQGKTFTYVVLHPEQITYESHKDSDVTFFTAMGLKQPAAASQFSLAKSAVSREKLQVVDADILLVGYPFGDEGVMTKSKFESDPLFKQLGAVKGGHYAVVDDKIAYPLAYPTPLSEPWLIENLVPVLSKAAKGK